LTRILIGGIGHETNTFCATTTPIDDFEILRGDAILCERNETGTYAAGMIAAANDLAMEPVCTYLAQAEPSGVIEARAYGTMKEQLLDAMSAAQPADAVALCLHGAGTAEGVDNLEVDICRAVRRLVGSTTPIVISLDLHGNLTQELAEQVDLMLGVHLYPHTDMRERGYEAVSLIPRLLDGKLRPVAHVEHLPMLLPSTSTLGGRMAVVNALCAELESRDGVIDLTFFHGFPFTDVPHTGAAVVATTNGDLALAEELAEAVASYVWAHRDEFLPRLLSAEEAVAAAIAVGEGPVVINETSDNPGGGAPGDGTHLLRAMLQARLDRACFGFICDPATAAAAAEAGPGAWMDVVLGGGTDQLHGAPIRARAFVKAITDGDFVLTNWAPGLRMRLGTMVRLVIDGIDVIVGSRRSQTFDPELFLLHGIDVRRYRYVGLKSSQHFRAGFQELARAIVTADTPGLLSQRLSLLHRRRVARPIWPLDSEASYPAPAPPLPQSGGS
jgi:microcystin degradation protein MlrC